MAMASRSSPNAASSPPGAEGPSAADAFVSAGPPPVGAASFDWEPFKELSETVSYVFWLVQLVPERVLYVSPGFERIWQRTAQAIYNDPRLWVEAIHPDDKAPVHEAYERFLAAPEVEPFDVEYRIVRVDGSLRWIHDRARVVRNAEGVVDRVAGMAEDITPRRGAEDALRESEHRFRQLVQSLPMPVWTCAPNGVCTFLSDAFMEYTGRPLAEHLGAGWVKTIHPEDQARVALSWREAVAAGLRYHTEFRIRRHDGVYRWFDAQAEPIRDEHGEIVKWFGATTDIHDSHELRESLREEQDRFNRIVTTVPGVIHSFRLRPDGTVSFPYASPMLREVYGVDPSDVVSDGSAVLRLTHPEDSRRMGERVRESARMLSPFHAELRACSPRGGEMWIEIRSQPVREADGGVIWHGFLADVTERKRVEAEIRSLNAALEERVRQRTEELEAANRELEAFSYSVSHDLRAPLRAVDGYSGALVEDFGAILPDEARRYLGEVRAAAQRMGTLIDDLLAFSRLGRQTLALRHVDTAMLVRETLAELTGEASGRALELHVGALDDCVGDPSLLKQVWVNLLSNALKYTRGRAPAIVEVGCERVAGEVVYYVRDNGAGFDMRYAHKLFRVFQRLHRADEFEGTGVGLAIVKRIVDRHGGHVSVDAAVDAGATFRFTIGEAEVGEIAP
jgi:PAS domain S-box-containing protein